MEGRRVSAEAARLAVQQEKTCSNYQVLTVVAVVVYRPVLIALEGNGPIEVELGRLKEERKAIGKY